MSDQWTLLSLLAATWGHILVDPRERSVDGQLKVFVLSLVCLLQLSITEHTIVFLTVCRRL